MPKMTVKILRDVAKNPNIIEIVRNNRKISVTYDGDNMTFEGDQSQFPNIAEALQMAFPYELERQTRPEWFDRNPASAPDYYIAEVGAHAEVARITRIVPPDRLFRMDSLTVQMTRTVASLTATPLTNILMQVAPHTIPGFTYNTINLTMFNNNVGAIEKLTLPHVSTFYPQDQIWLMTSSVGGDGTERTRFNIGYNGTLYDI